MLVMLHAGDFAETRQRREKKNCRRDGITFGQGMPTKLTFYGHSAFKLVLPSGAVILIDPWLKNPAWNGGEKELEALDRVDVICLTHGHFDHVGDAVEIARKSKPRLMCTFDCAVAVRNALKFPSQDDDSALVSHIGGTVRILDGEVTGRFTPAWHGAAVMPSEDAPPVYGGTPTGVVFSIKGGPTIYHTGDTDLFSDMALVPLEQPIDYMLVCIGDHFTMGPRRAAEAVKLVKPRVAVPMHFGTFPPLIGTPEQFRAELEKTGPAVEMRALKPGETLDL